MTRGPPRDFVNLRRPPPHNVALYRGTENQAMADDVFELYDLRVEVVAPDGATIQCHAERGDHFEVRGEMLHLPPGQGFSMYSLAALLPLLPVKQRATDPNDWMSTDAEVACPDPHCPTRFRITRLGKRRFRHGETTAVSLPGQG
jgi:uncharacterized repeat protein (TIGR04076 family)